MPGSRVPRDTDLAKEYFMNRLPRVERSSSADALVHGTLGSATICWRNWALGWSFWTLLSLLTAMQSYFGQAAVMEWRMTWLLAVRRSFEEWYAWGLLSIPILWLARRFPFNRARAWRWGGFHFLASICFSVAYVAIHSWTLDGQTSVMDGTRFEFRAVFKKLIVYYSQVCMIIYWFMILVHQGWHFYHRLREREIQSAELQTELVNARLEALRMQINPHFLFNTLHTISSLIHENPEAADRMVARLSELLRVSLDQANTHEIRLEQEIDFLKGYIEIEQTRFADRLSVELKIEPGVEEAFVPCLILQPLVENAIRHGIEPREDMGKVEVEARRDNGRLELRVSDNGSGLETDLASRREGIVLSNTRSRLRHLYGEHQMIVLADAPGGGLEVRLSIPYRSKSHAAAIPNGR